jgi:hypothetical protein
MRSAHLWQISFNFIESRSRALTDHRLLPYPVA